MKTKILLIVSSLFMLSCGSQKNATKQVIRYNFNAGSFDESNIKPIHGKPIVLEINNINNLFYKVEITPKDIAIRDKTLFDDTTEPPKKDESPDLGEEKKFAASTKIEKEIEKPQNKQKLKEKIDLTSKVDNIQSQIVINKSLINQKNIQKQSLAIKKSDIEKELNSIKPVVDLEKEMNLLTTENIKEKEVINKQLESRKDLEEKKKEYNEKIEEIELEITQYEADKNNLNTQLEDLNNKTKTSKELIINYLSDLKTKYTQLYASAESISRINGCYNNYIDKVYTPELTFEEYERIKKRDGLENPIIIDKYKLNDFYIEINQFDKNKTELLMKLNDIELYKIREKLAELPNGESLIADLNSDIDEIKKDVTDISKTVNDLNIRKKLNYVESLDRILSTRSSYSYTSVPIQGFEDYLQFNVTIISKTKVGEDKYIIDRSKTFEYKEYLKGGARFDFSIGTVFDIGTKQQEFGVEQEGIKYKIVQKTTNQYIPTIAGMLHTSWRSANNFAFGFTLGVSMDMTKLQLNSLFPGVSILIGKTDKIIFTAGPALRKVSQLTNGFTLNTPLVLSPQGYTSESYRLGWFVGVSWNLTNKQKSLMRLSY